MIDIQSAAYLDMDSRDILDFRKRKSDVFSDEVPNKKASKDTFKPESTPKQLLRRFSTRFKLIGSGIKSKNKNFENPIKEDGANETDKLTNNMKTNTSMIYFTASQQKKSAVNNDRLSNSSDNSRQSSTSGQHIKLGIDLFNFNSECGVDYFQSNGIVNKDKDLAELFMKKNGFNRSRMSDYMTDPENLSIHIAFCNLLDLKKKTVVETIQEYLKYSLIRGEYQRVIKIMDHLSQAYFNQNLEKDILGLNLEQLTIIFQFLMTFYTSQIHEKSNRLTREDFIKMLNDSLKSNGISRSYALSLYYELSEVSFDNILDTRTTDLDKVSKLITDLPKEFHLIQYFRYVICHVDLCQVILPHNGSDKISYHDRTVFLFNDCLITSKRKGGMYDTNQYRFKQVIKLLDIKCAFVKRNGIQLIQISDLSNNILGSFYSKINEDFTNFYTSLEQAIGLHRSVVDYQKLYQARSSSR